MELKSTNKVAVNDYELDVAIDGATFEAAVAKAYKQNIGKMNISGFRKGHAPRAVVEKMYGKDIFYNDAFEALYPQAVEEAISESKLEVVEASKLELVSMDENGVNFKVTVVVKPDVEIKDYKGIKAEKPAVTVEDDEIDSELNRMRERNARVIDVEDRAAKIGDMTVIDFDGSVDGVRFDGGKAEGYSLELGSGLFVPGFEEQVAGHNVGDEFDVKVKFPEDYQFTEIAGKDAVFACKLHNIKAKELPELDDEFAKDVSEFDTLKELKEDIKKNITKSKEEQAENTVESTLIEKMLDGFKAEIPDAMINQKIDENVNDFSYRLQSQGLKLEDYLKYSGLDMEAFRGNFKENAERQVKVRLALEKIADIEKLVVTEDEINAEYDKFKQAYDVEMERIKAAIPEKEVRGDLLVKKAVDFVKENAVISEAKPKKSTSAKKSETAEKKPAAKKTDAKKSNAESKSKTTKVKAEKADKAE
ncbi:MAG: trigger factor [Acutalibacteraceae bacterium]